MVKKTLIITALILLITIATANAVWYDAIAYYTFDNDTNGYLNDSGNLNYGYNLTGNTTYSTGVSSALKNASVYTSASATNRAVVNITNFSAVKTIDFWFKETDNTANQVIGVSAGLWADTSNQFEMDHYIGGNPIVYLYFKAGGSTKCGMEIGSFASGSWHHLVLTGFGTKILIYKNGVNTYNCSTTATIPNNWQLVVGYYGGAYSSDTMIDNLLLSTSNYTQEDVTTSYNSGAGTKFSWTTTPANIGNNFSIITKSEWNTSTIYTFNATINGTLYQSNTTTGILNSTTLTNISTTINITIQAEGYYNLTILNLNISGYNTVSYIANLTKTVTWTPNISCNLQGTNNTGYNTSIEINITDEYLTNTSINFENLTGYNNTNHTRRNNHRYNITNMNITNITNIGTYQINISATNYGNNTLNYTCNYTITPDQNYLIIAIRNYQNTSNLADFTAEENHTGNTTTTNPFTLDPYRYLNKTTYLTSLYVNATDNTGQHLPTNKTFGITRHNLTHYMEMNPTKLIISFIDIYGNPINASGHIQDNMTGTVREMYFINTTIIFVQTELAIGRVNTQFGTNGTSVNQSQFYEYINDGTDHITETISINQLNDDSIYFYVTDASGQSPMKDAYIRIYKINNNETSFAQGEVMGQRVTDDFGRTHFYADSTDRIAFQVIKNNYEMKYGVFAIKDYDYTSTNPLKISLDRESTTTDYVAAFLPDKITNLTNAVSGYIYAVGKDTIEYTTAYRQSLGMPNVELSCTNGECAITAIPGIDYPTTNTGGTVTFMIYADDEWNQNFTILDRSEDYYTNIGQTQTNLFTPEQMTQDAEYAYKNPILLLMVILMTFTLQLLIKPEQEGINIFKTGILIIAIISPPFWWAAGFVLLGEGLKTIRRLISE